MRAEEKHRQGVAIIPIEKTKGTEDGGFYLEEEGVVVEEEEEKDEVAKKKRGGRESPTTTSPISAQASGALRNERRSEEEEEQRDQLGRYGESMYKDGGDGGGDHATLFPTPLSPPTHSSFQTESMFDDTSSFLGHLDGVLGPIEAMRKSSRPRKKLLGQWPFE